MKPDISIIMGVYNLSPRYKKAIDSIMNQTYQNFEFIICDDKSTDNTLHILKKLEKSDSRIKVISNEKNSGLAFSLNHCLEYAKGKYIARMDDDDVSIPDRLEKERNFLINNPQYAFVASSYFIDDGENKDYTVKKLEKEPTKRSFLWNSPFCHPSTMFRRSALDKVGGYRVCKETRRAEDYDLYMRLYAANCVGYNIPEPLYVYYIGKKENKKKDKFVYSWENAKIRVYGYQKMKLPLLKSLPYIIKPLIIGALPSTIVYKLRTQRLQNKLRNEKANERNS